MTRLHRRGRLLLWAMLGLSLSLITLGFCAWQSAAVRASSYHTITIDGNCNDWLADEKFNGTDGTQTWLTWDASNIYVAWRGGGNAADKRVIAFDLDRGVDDGANIGYASVYFPSAAQPDYFVDFVSPRISMYVRTGNTLSSPYGNSEPPGVASSYTNGICGPNLNFVEISLPRSLFTGGSVSGLSSSDDMAVYSYFADFSGFNIYGAMPQNVCNPSGPIDRHFYNSLYFPSTDTNRNPLQYGSAATTTVTSLSPGSGTSVFGQSATITASVGGLSCAASTPGGTVDFYDGPTLLSTKALVNGQATYDLKTLNGGNHSLRASYTGETNLFETSVSSSIAWTITRTTATVSLGASASSVAYGQSITFNATVTASGGVGTPGGTVDFYAGATLIGTANLSSGLASFSLATLAAGSPVITAHYSGDSSFQAAISPDLTQIIGKANTTATLTSSPRPSEYAQTVTLKAIVGVTLPSLASANGSVNFYDGLTLLGTGSLNTSGVATFSTATLAGGSRNLRAVYAGDSNLNSSSSSDLAHLVTCYVVTLDRDDGSGSTCGTLSFALNQVVATSTPLTITLNVNKITLTGPLPVVTPSAGMTLTIKGGYSLTAGRCLPTTQLTAGIGAGNTGLTLTNNTVIDGLKITGFSSYGLNITGNNNTVKCSWLGTWNGITPEANGVGLRITGNNNQLGLPDLPESGNLLGGNSGPGVVVASGTGNLAYYNWIGLQKDGTTSLKNGGGAVKLLAGGNLKFGPGNRLKN